MVGLRAEASQCFEGEGEPWACTGRDVRKIPTPKVQVQGLKTQGEDRFGV